MRLVRITLAVVVIFGIVVGVAYANHNGAVVTSNTIACGETTFSAHDCCPWWRTHSNQHVSRRGREWRDAICQHPH